MKFRTFLLTLSLAAASCAGTHGEHDARPAETLRVTVGSGPRLDVASRTTLGPDGRVDWAADDRIALWAFDASGEAQLAQHPFLLWHYNAEYCEAKFTADIPAMPSGTYVYWAAYPEPATVDGTLVSYDIPAVQDGAYHADCDIMTARCTGPALQEGDNSDRIHFAFAHRIHLLKITVPTSQLGDRATSIELEFPQPVAGRLTLDANDPDAEPQLTEGTSHLTLRFPEPIDAGATVYAAIAPVDIPAEGTVSIRTCAATGESRTDTFAGRTFAAGHTTPIEYNIPEMELRYTVVRFTLDGDGSATLGEPVQRITLSTDGARFDNGEAQRTFEANAEGVYTMVFKEFTGDLSGKPVTVTYDSEHAVVANAFTMPQLQANAQNDAATLTVPYLLEADFDRLAGDYVWNLNGEDGNKDHNDTASYFPEETGLAAWSGNQLRIERNRLRLRNRREYAAKFLGMDSWGNYPSRVDSAPLEALKGSYPNIKLRVQFDYGGATENSVFTPTMSFGWTENRNALTAYWDVYVGNRLSNSGGTPLDNKLIDSRLLATDASWDTPLTTETCIIDRGSPEMRLSWEANATGAKTSTYNNQWLYLDNIRVSIVTE